MHGPGQVFSSEAERLFETPPRVASLIASCEERGTPSQSTRFRELSSPQESTFRDDTIRDDTIRDDTIRDDTIRDDTLRDDTLRDKNLRLQAEKLEFSTALSPIYAENYFVPGEGISRKVITNTICRYLGPHALVKPYRHADVGFLVTLCRCLIHLANHI
jgi:hypothetical protein